MPSFFGALAAINPVTVKRDRKMTGATNDDTVKGSV
jgi:hypothetical protein